MFDFTAATLAIDTFANSSLSGTTSAYWTLYHRRESETEWTQLGTLQGAAISGTGTSGPTPIAWHLAALGRLPETVHFLLDPETTGFGTNGTANQRGIGFGNLRLTAVCESALDFTGWRELHELADVDPTSDDDHDRIPASLEYALGLDPRHPDPSPAEWSGNLLTYRKGVDAAAAGVVYQIEISSDLGSTDPWAATTPATDDFQLIQAAMPTGHPRLFARLAVTVP